MPAARVTVTLPPEVVQAIDRHERNRSRFVLEAVERELERRRREELRRSLSSPHPEALQVAEEGVAGWGAGLPDEETLDLIDTASARPVQWVADEGWVEKDA